MNEVNCLKRTETLYCKEDEKTGDGIESNYTEPHIHCVESIGSFRSRIFCFVKFAYVRGLEL